MGAHQLFRDGNGLAYLFYGPLAPGTASASSANAILFGEPPITPEEEDLFGESVAAAGDVDGDGFDDVIVAASNNRAGGVRAGRAYVFRGPLAGPIQAEAADRTFTGAAENLLGTSLAPVGDLNGDGAGEVFIGAPGVFESGVVEYAGVFHGRTPTNGAPSPETQSTALRLSDASPNPLAHSTRITVAVTRGQAVRVDLVDALGRSVAVLFEGSMRPGETRLLEIDAAGLAGGVYVVRASGETSTVATRVVVRSD